MIFSNYFMPNVHFAQRALESFLEYEIILNIRVFRIEYILFFFIALMFSCYINDWPLHVCLVSNANSVFLCLTGNVFWQGRCGSAQLLKVFSGAFTEGEGSSGAPAGVSKQKRRTNPSPDRLGQWVLSVCTPKQRF